MLAIVASFVRPAHNANKWETNFPMSLAPRGPLVPLVEQVHWDCRNQSLIEDAHLQGTLFFPIQPPVMERLRHHGYSELLPKPCFR